MIIQIINKILIENIKQVRQGPSAFPSAFIYFYIFTQYWSPFDLQGQIVLETSKILIFNFLKNLTD